MQVSQTENYPEYVRMVGLPPHLQGWNSLFKKTDKISDGAPIYHLESYILYKYIYIIGVTLLRVDGVWHLQRDCDHPGDYVWMGIRKLTKTTGGPVGRWSFGARVVETQSYLHSLYIYVTRFFSYKD